jgi:hypothetical protein
LNSRLSAKVTNVEYAGVFMVIHSLPLANVILAYHAPYVMAVLLCFIVLPIEYFVFWLFQRRRPFSSLKIFGQIILANIISLIAGVIISAFIPSLGTMWQGGMSTDYLWGIYFGYIFAFFISWYVEYHVMSLLNKKTPFPNLTKTIGYANMASYVVLYIITIVPFILK